MGAIRWSKTSYSTNPAKQITTLGFAASGTHTSSGTVSTVAGLTVNAGDVLEISSDTNGWIRGGGQNAAVGTGRQLIAGQLHHFEADQISAGAVTVIDG